MRHLIEKTCAIQNNRWSQLYYIFVLLLFSFNAPLSDDIFVNFFYYLLVSSGAVAVCIGLAKGALEVADRIGNEIKGGMAIIVLITIFAIPLFGVFKTTAYFIETKHDIERAGLHPKAD